MTRVRFLTIELLLLCHIASPCNAQITKIDSLKNVLLNSKEDTSKINSLNELSKRLSQQGDYNPAMQNSNAALALSKKINFPRGVSAAHNGIGDIYKLRGDYSLALENYLASLKIETETGNKQGLGICYENIGSIYEFRSNHDEALENYFASMKIYEELQNKKGMARIQNNIGSLYYYRHDYTRALENYSLALKIREAIGDKNGIAGSYNNIGIIYFEQGHYAKALNNYFFSLKIYEELQNKKGMARIYNNIGTIYLKQNKIGEARKQSLLNLSIAKEIGVKEAIREAYLLLSLCDSAEKNWEGAYDYHRSYTETKDSIFNQQSNKQLAEMQTKYETEKKEQQITLLNKDAELKEAKMNRQLIIIWSVAAGFLVVLMLSMFIYKERKKSEKLLLNILPAETAKELKANGKATARHYESVTVMFTDFKGFTSIAEKLSAEELVSELDFLFRKFDEIISKYNIEKIKTIGDAYMCASGLPVANSDHAENIVKAAMEIQHWMISQNSKWKLRIGIHSGPVTAGVVGDKKFAYDIWGDTVNTASRMESSGEPGKVNISGATYQRLISPIPLIPTISFVHRGKIPAKNKGEIDMYFVESV